MKRRSRKRKGLRAANWRKPPPPKATVTRGDASEIRRVIDVLRDTFRHVGFSRPADWERDFLTTAYRYFREWTSTGQAKVTAKNLRIMFEQGHRDLAVALMAASAAPLTLAQLRERSQAFRYAYSKKVKAKDFLSFVDNEGGVNSCARKFGSSPRSL